MNEREFIKKIKNLNLGVITISDVANIINKDRKYATLYINRLEDRGVIERIEKGKYLLDDTDIQVAATNLVFPSYISFLSGLSYHHKTTQIPILIQIITATSRKNIYFQKNKIEFINLDKKRIFGYKKEKMKNGYVFIGEIEKIIVDSLFLPKYCPLSEIKNAIDDIKINKILSYGLRMDSIVALKRLGYILELNDIDVYDKLKNHLNKRYDLLNPFLSKTGKNNKKWMLKINEAL